MTTKLVPRFIRDEPCYWLAITTFIAMCVVLSQEFHLIPAAQFSSYLTTRLSIMALLCGAGLMCAVRPQQLIWQDLYTIFSYVYIFQGEYFRPGYVFALAQFQVAEALFFRQKLKNFLLMHAVLSVAFLFWMRFLWSDNLPRFNPDNMLDGYTTMVYVSFILTVLIYVKITRVKEEKERSHSRFLLVGKQAVNIIHDLKSLASSPQIYMDMLLSRPSRLDPETEKVLSNLRHDLSSMVEKTRDLYTTIRLGHEAEETEAVGISWERATSFVSHRLTSVIVVKTGTFTDVYAKGSLELIFLNLIYNTLAAFQKNGTQLPTIQVHASDQQITYWDNAGGISDEIQQRVGSDQYVKGQGLGLYLMQDAAKSSRLHLEFKNESRGSGFGLRVKISALDF